ncbi:MAG: hypothetical protein QNM02_02310 [Acidimicrobiia bacterium]|nr:hypothetical protein [Acidimicrobiia bacterium]
MAKLVLLVVAAAWAAVLIPPMLRSRVDNRPNSSVTDFRRQLSKLQSTATPGRGPMRAMGRPLTQSPLQRPAAGARPTHPHHRQASLHSGTATAPAPSRQSEPVHDAQRYRTHGDPSGAHERPPAADSRAAQQTSRSREAQPGQHHHRQTRMARPVDPAAAVKRRRTNVLFVLVIITACTMFLAATTSSTTMLYVFALSFLALCGYVYLLAQLRQRQGVSWDDGWLDQN